MDMLRMNSCIAKNGADEVVLNIRQGREKI